MKNINLFSDHTSHSADQISRDAQRNIFEKLEDLLKGGELLKGGDLLIDFRIKDKYSHTVIFSRKNQQAKRAVRDIIQILQEKN